MSKRRPKSQPRIPGVKREPLPSCVMASIRREVEKEASRHNVSRSFVVAVALAHAFGIKDQLSY